MKKELDRQLLEAKLARLTRISSTSSVGPPPLEQIDDEGDDDEDMYNESDLQEDLINNADTCAFPSTSEEPCLSNKQVYHLLNNRSDLFQFAKGVEQQLKKPQEQMCTGIDLSTLNICRRELPLRAIRFDLDRHYEVYFESSNQSALNLLTIENLRSLCRKQNRLLAVFQLDSTCHYTLPQMIAFFANKANCSDLAAEDIEHFIGRMQRCHRLYDTGLIRLSGLKRYRKKPIELFEYDSCFRHNFTFLTLEYLLDKNFLQTNQTHYTAMWFLKPKHPKKLFNGSETHTANSAYDLFLRHFYRNPKFDDGWTRISALNFLDIRISTAMKQIRADMFFVILAISLIVGVSDLFSSIDVYSSSLPR